MISLRIKLGLATALMMLSAVAFGHRFHAGITDVSVNPQQWQYRDRAYFDGARC